MPHSFHPTRATALARIHALDPSKYARTRNSLEGAVSHLSPYITHGFVTLPEVLAGVRSQHPLEAGHKFVYELGWREFFQYVWQRRGAEIFTSLHGGPLADSDYLTHLPNDIRQAATGVPVIDQAVRTLYETGYLHNHARMWLASFVVHIRKVHWRVAADWLYGHLLDGDLASNHLSWQWVAGTGSNKPYLFNADNVARYAPAPWHSPASIIDQSYETLDKIARQTLDPTSSAALSLVGSVNQIEPPLMTTPPANCNPTPPDSRMVAGRTVWLVHPWNLHELPTALSADTLVLGIFLSDFHSAWPWSVARWQFVTSRMNELTRIQWYGDAATIGEALKGARRVGTTGNLHLEPWLSKMAACEASPTLFAPVTKPCDSFSQWWRQATREMPTAHDLQSTHSRSAHQPSS